RLLAVDGGGGAETRPADTSDSSVDLWADSADRPHALSGLGWGADRQPSTPNAAGAGGIRNPRAGGGSVGMGWEIHLALAECRHPGFVIGLHPAQNPRARRVDEWHVARLGWAVDS